MNAPPRIGLTFRLPSPLVAGLRERFSGLAIAGPGIEPQQFNPGEAEVLLGWPKADVVRDAKALKWIQLFAAGTEIIDFDDVTRRGIVVTNARGVASPNIAEHVLAMMLHFNRRLGLLLRAQIARNWIARNTFDYPELTGQIVLVVGAGSIGREIAKRAQALGMRVFGISQSGRALAEFEKVVAIADKDALLDQADHVVACVPGIPATAAMFNSDWFSRMKRGACFYNVGRGTTVDESALLYTLNSGHLAGAGLDVTGEEPLPPNHPLWAHESVLLTQHKAMNSGRYWERLTALFGDNLESFVAGRPLRNTVDPARKY
jgi:phosphoglycerate dehydrogenase-like enzyme